MSRSGRSRINLKSKVLRSERGAPNESFAEKSDKVRFGGLRATFLLLQRAPPELAAPDSPQKYRNKCANTETYFVGLERSSRSSCGVVAFCRCFSCSSRTTPHTHARTRTVTSHTLIQEQNKLSSFTCNAECVRARVCVNVCTVECSSAHRRVSGEFQVERLLGDTWCG